MAAPARRRSSRPRKLDIADRVLQAGADALTITTGQAIVRLVPQLLPLPQTGAVGLAISTATAILAGMAAERVVSRDTARMLTAGAISVPLQRAAMTYLAPSVPLVGKALGLGRYPARRSLAGYSPARNARRIAPGGGRPGVAGYDFAANSGQY